MCLDENCFWAPCWLRSARFIPENEYCFTPRFLASRAVSYVVSPREDTAPLTVKLYINRQSMGFSDTDDMEPAQTLELTPDDLVAGSVSVLKFVKFQRVSGLSVRFRCRQGCITPSLVISTDAERLQLIERHYFHSKVSFLGDRETGISRRPPNQGPGHVRLLQP